MKKYSISSRMLSVLLIITMILSIVPPVGVSAASIDAEGYLGSIKILDNGESISLPIRLNNFAMDGMLFEYLSSVYNNSRDSQYFLYEAGGTYQLFSLHLAGKKVGVDLKGALADKDGQIQPDTDAMSGSVDLQHSLTSPQGTDTPNYLGVTSGGTEYWATLYPAKMKDGGGTMYLQLRQTDRDKYAESGRTWRKLTRFTGTKTVSQSRYAVIIYRVNGDTHYDDMLLTWDYYNEKSDKSNCSQVVPVVKNVDKTADAQWQYVIIDMAYNLGSNEEARAAAAAQTTIQDVYLKSPMNYFMDGYNTEHTYNGTKYPATGNSMDLAAVAYFPYYGDAEQFAHYGLSLGCDLKYYYRDNRGFDFINATRTSGNNNSVQSVVQWDTNHFDGKHLYNSNTTGTLTLNADGSGGAVNTVKELNYALFGQMGGYATLGLLESQLDENGRPVYREVAVNFIATYLRNRLTAVEEYPADNHGWKNYSFVTGVSTNSDIDEQLFGKDTLERSIDLGTALCDCVEGAKKGGGANSGTMGSYAQTRAKASELIGTWDECKGKIDTWFDAAYYLLHNLYVSDQDTAYSGDGYGEYEDDFQNLVMDQVLYKDASGNVTEAYCFDSGFCLNGDTTNSAVIYDKEGHILRIDPNADTTGGRDPFLPTSGTGTETGETNSPYYIDDYVIQHGRGYRKRDYLYTISGNGSFQYHRDLFFEFKGDDDVYLFINGQLVLDIGGTHSATLSKIQLDDYVDHAWDIKNGKSLYKGLTYEQLSGADRARVDALALEEGDVYSFDFFYMERHGAGANLRIVTNIKVSGEGLNVDKSAYQKGIEIAENGIVNVDAPIEYAFKITNDSAENLRDLTFQDTILGVTIDYENGLTVSDGCAPYVTNASGGPLTPADLQIRVFGKEPGSELTVTCKDNEELKAFLKDLTSDDVISSGDGLWRDESIQIRGIYYTLTDAQKAVGSFRNYVSATANAGGIILRGADDHIVYQPGKLAYYQWVGEPVVIEREKFYHDLLGSIVTSADQLPALGNMILIPSDVNGVERQDNGLVNTKGGDVYLKIAFSIPRTYVAYVTIRDVTDPSYRMTVPVTIYATATKDEVIVLDYGLDADLTKDDALFDYELDLAVGGNVTGTILGIAGDNIQPPSYLEYDTGSLDTAIGNTPNELTLINGSYADGVSTNARFQLDAPIFLDHGKPWVVEFKVGNMKYNDCLLSSAITKMSEDKKERLYLTNTGIGLGYSDGSKERFYGVAYDKFRTTDMTTVKLFNVPAGDGSNMVYCSINGGAATAMDTVFIDRVNQNTTDSTWINGRDFTFEYLGCNGHALYLDMEYLRVYEAGEQLVHYRWEASETGYDSTSTGKPGFQTNTATDASSETDRDRWELSDHVVLNDDRAWEIEFGMQLPSTDANFMLLSSTENKVDDKTTYVYIVPGKRFISMGSNVGGTYINYGALLPKDFDLTAAHTYLLKNRVAADGTNMVYLYVDKDENGVWTEIGPLNYYSEGSSIGTISTGLSGKDFSFKYIGGYGLFGLSDQQISYIEVREDTALRTAYEWQSGTDRPTSIHATGDGNRISFTKEETGIVTDGEGTFTLEDGKLRFQLSGFMDQEYTAYVAFAIHDKNHTPTPLGQPIDVAKEVQLFKKITFVPANVVYYEDDFGSIHYVESVVDDRKNEVTSSGESTLDKSQSLDQSTEYGSDPFYQDVSSTMSGGHVTEILVRADDSRLAWFEFKGTGFELISNTNAVDSAIIYIEVYHKDDVTISGDTLAADPADALEWILLVPEFDHGDDGGNEVIHQVPLIRWQREDDGTTDADESLTPDEFVVTINGYATYDYDSTEAPLIDTYHYVDGIRIFQPMGYDHAAYNTLENKVLFTEIRDQIIDSKLMVGEKTDAGVIINSGTVTWTEDLTGVDHTGAPLVGNKVESVNDYLLKGPNNEVYMDGSSGNSSIAFVVYGDAGHNIEDMGLQIAVRAIDRGNFFGTGSTGLGAALELGVLDADGIHSWMPLASVTSGTEQYITIPYELCPVVLNEDTMEYHVIIRVSASSDEISPMVSFSSIKHSEGLHLKENISDKVTIQQDENGQWVTSQGKTEGVANILMMRRGMMAVNVIAPNEAVPGEEFVDQDVTPDNVPAIMPKYPTLSFDEEVRYNIYYTVQELGDVALEDMGLITFDWENVDGTVTDAVDVIPGAFFDGSQYMVRTNGIPAKDLGDTLYFKVYAKLPDGSYVYSDMHGYSAKAYAQQQLAGTADSIKPLVVAMLNYGAAAQKFFDYKTDTLMNAELTAEQQALVMDHHSGMVSDVVSADSDKVGVFVNDGGFLGTRPSVSFEGAFAINYYSTPSHAVDGDMTLFFWDLETYHSVDVLTVENATGSKTMVPVDGTDAYFTDYTGIAAKDLDETVYVAAVYTSDGVTHCTGVLAYSLAEYCKGFADDPTSPMQELAAATTVYGYYAKDYFADR